jgi:hypothetical protein
MSQDTDKGAVDAFCGLLIREYSSHCAKRKFLQEDAANSKSMYSTVSCRILVANEGEENNYHLSFCLPVFIIDNENMWQKIFYHY